jgi:hypothetical protein
MVLSKCVIANFKHIIPDFYRNQILGSTGPRPGMFNLF